MIRHLYFLLFLLPVANGLRAQCTTDAGTLGSVPANLCEGAVLTATHSGNAVLDTNDVLVYVVFTGSNPQVGTILATSADGNFVYNPAFLDNSPVYVAAVAGNNDGSGGVDWSDPCLSYSPDLVVQIFATPDLTVSGGTIICVPPFPSISATSNATGAQFVWTGPGGFTSINPTPVVSIAGNYCVTVTSNAGCTATSCTDVILDTSPPIISLDETSLSCTEGMATIWATVSNCSQCVLNWTGTGILSGDGTSMIEVNEVGIYELIAVNLDNVCGASVYTIIEHEQKIPNGNFAATNASCFNTPNGAVSLTTLPNGVQPFTFAWSGGPNNYFSSTEQNITGLLPGVYYLEATDATGCSFFGSALVSSPQAIGLPAPNQFITQVNCFGESTGAINITATGGTLPFSYSWAGPNGFTSTQEDLFGILAGTYSVTVTDALGCTLTPSPFVISQPDALVVDVSIVNCGANTLITGVTGGLPPYAYSWSDGNTTAVITDLIPGNYTVTVTDANGCTSIGTYNFTGSTNNLCGYIHGRLVLDTTLNCFSDTLEPGIAGWIVEAVDGSNTYYGVSNAAGYFKISVEAGNYILQVTAPNSQLWNVCLPAYTVGQVNPDDTVTVPDVPIKEVLQCPLLEVSVSSGFIRRCFSNNYFYVNYCNHGTASAENANIVVDLDPFLSIVSSNASYVDLGNNQYLFEIGDLDVGDCGTFYLQVSVSCDAVLGQTHCVEAVANPHDCIPVDPLWSGASLSLHSECSPDSVFFIIKNTGMGNMSADAEYIVIEDAVMRAMGTDLRLDSGDSMRISVPANGATWRVEVTQEPLHPGASQPMLSVEGCSSTGVFTTGFVSQFSSDDDDPWIDIDCRPNIGAYDPNDKQGFPIGYGAQRYIKPGTDIEYLIRFQNTGTDTAFNVYVLDTLSAWLDPASIRLGASSHPFVFDIYGNGILKFDFPNIMLPDSNVNEPLSNGFVQFRIEHRDDAPLETVIENRAAIYFDFNEPIITNTTEHRLGENFLSVKSWEALRPGLKLDVAPNPSFDVARVTVNGLKGGEDLRLRICDLQGRTVRELPGSGGVFEIQRGAMPAGVYQLVLFVDGVAAGNGKMMVK